VNTLWGIGVKRLKSQHKAPHRYVFHRVLENLLLMKDQKSGFYVVAVMYSVIGIVLAFPVYFFALSKILPEKFGLMICIVAFGLFGLFSAFRQDTELDDSWLGIIGQRGRLVLGGAACQYFLWSLAKSVF
jgi:hypothetical protein